MIQLNDNNMKIIVPFIKKHSMSLLIHEKFNLIYPFIYKMYKKGIITSEELKEKLKLKSSSRNLIFISWFLPELIELGSDFEYMKYIFKYRQFENTLLFYCENQDRIDEYKQMRDKGEYDDEMATALRNDDVDKFQSIVSKNEKTKLNQEIQQNMFDYFFCKSNITYLNYAAAYGSVKCFKYILLNDGQINNLTFKMAVSGGNNEIIRIVYNKTIEYFSNPRFIKSANESAIKRSIKTHQNNVFDWIIDQTLKNLGQNDLYSLVSYSIENANSHALIYLIDNGFIIQDCKEQFNLLLKISCERGFYTIANFLINIMGQEYNQALDKDSIVYFDSVSIFQLF